MSEILPSDPIQRGWVLHKRRIYAKATSPTKAEVAAEKLRIAFDELSRREWQARLDKANGILLQAIIDEGKDTSRNVGGSI